LLILGAANNIAINLWEEKREKNLLAKDLLCILQWRVF